MELDNLFQIKSMQMKLFLQLKKYVMDKKSKPLFIDTYEKILFYVDEIDLKTNERTLETVLFKNYIKESNINEIICEIFLKN